MIPLTAPTPVYAELKAAKPSLPAGRRQSAGDQRGAVKQGVQVRDRRHQSRRGAGGGLRPRCRTVAVAIDVRRRESVEAGFKAALEALGAATC